MVEEIIDLLEVRESSRVEKSKLRYRKGVFTATIPEGLDVDVEELVESNLDWFNSHLEEARKYRKQVPSREFKEGEIFLILGDKKKVNIGKRRSNNVKEDILLAEHLVESTSLKDQLEKALREFARERFDQKASQYTEQINGDFEKIFIRDQKTRWGSCSGKGNLNFNWRLVLGPEMVLDYVLVHELVHLEIKNHSKAFEKRVREIFPEASKARKWLDENSAKLVFDPDF